MQDSPLILVVDDNPVNVDILRTRLEAHGYRTIAASDGEEALAAAREHHPDLILLDVMMPKLDGIEVCRRLRADPDFPFTPIVMVTAKGETQDVIAALDAGADEYLVKPPDQGALVARVKSMLRIKALHDTVQHQSAQLAEWNHTLEERVARQVEELERLNRLRRFLSPQLADLIVSSGEQDDSFLRGHRAEVTVVFCDLRGYTPFAETAAPEDLMSILHQYHAAMGALVHEHAGTLERFAGDGFMVFFNDPVPQPDPAARAVRMTVTMRDRMAELCAAWRRLGHELGFGAGIALGYATAGRIGFEGRYDYAAIGPVTNLAGRLCAAAQDGQILISQRVHAEVEHLVEAVPVENLTLKGVSRPLTVFDVQSLRTATAALR
jgi:class 3 adenylate cyclase